MKTSIFSPSNQSNFSTQKSTNAMKLIASMFLFCLMSLSGFAQPVKYSFEELTYSPGEKGKGACIYSESIEDAQGHPKYTVTAYVDIQNKKIINVGIREYGTVINIPLDKITHINRLYLTTPNVQGVEAFACKGAGTNVVFYYLIGANTEGTLKFLFYQPSGPQSFQMAN